MVTSESQCVSTDTKEEGMTPCGEELTFKLSIKRKQWEKSLWEVQVLLGEELAILKDE